MSWIFEWNDGGGGGDYDNDYDDDSDGGGGGWHFSPDVVEMITCWEEWVWQGVRETNACNIVVENLER